MRSCGDYIKLTLRNDIMVIKHVRVIYIKYIIKKTNT